MEISPDIFANASKFYPVNLVAAVHQELRSNPEKLIRSASLIADQLVAFIERQLQSGPPPRVKKALEAVQKSKITVSVRFVRLHKYLDIELKKRFGANNSQLLLHVRKQLSESVAPMSLHLALIRIGVGNATVCDVLCDTTEPNLTPFCHVVYNKFFAAQLKKLAENGGSNLGDFVQGF